jgi:hypothetical protein
VARATARSDARAERGPQGIEDHAAHSADRRAMQSGWKRRLRGGLLDGLAGGGETSAMVPAESDDDVDRVRREQGEATRSSRDRGPRHRRRWSASELDAGIQART